MRRRFQWLMLVKVSCLVNVVLIYTFQLLFERKSKCGLPTFMKFFTGMDWIRDSNVYVQRKKNTSKIWKIFMFVKLFFFYTKSNGIKIIEHKFMWFVKFLGLKNTTRKKKCNFLSFQFTDKFFEVNFILQTKITMPLPCN